MQDFLIYIDYLKSGEALRSAEASASTALLFLSASSSKDQSGEIRKLAN